MSSSSITFPIASTSKLPSNRPSPTPFLPNTTRTFRFKPVSAKKETKKNQNHGGNFNSVDENMIVLRKRIHDMEVAENNYEAPSDWTQWEKRYYTTYGSDVCGFVGLIQVMLLQTRPAFAVGFLALVGLSLPTSIVLLWLQLMGK